MPHVNIAELLVGLGAQVAQDIRTDNPAADGYVRAIGRLMQHASKWAAVSASGIQCATRFTTPIGELRPCSTAAIGACVACGQPTCFSHAMVSPADGQLVCYGCVGVAQRIARRMGADWHAEKQPPPQPQDRRSAPGIRCSCRFPWERDDDCPVHGEDESALRREHLETLGLDIDATWDQIRAAYRKLALKHHPDRATARRKAEAEKKFKAITKAFEWLKEQKEKVAA